MKTRYLVWAGITLAAALAYGAFGPGKLTIAGTAVDTNFIVKDNHVYVPLADVAKALQYEIQKTPDGYDLEPAGGADQVNGVNGKIGDTIKLGFATIKVTKVFKGDHYAKQFTDGTVDATDGKQTIVAVTMRVKNATHEPLTLNPFGDENTALVDDADHAFQQFTGMASDITDRGPKLLPGSAYDFALVFQVPKSANVAQLVYGIAFYDGHNPKKVVRILLAE